MVLYSVFDVFEAKGVIQETGSSVDVHKKTLCCKVGYTTFFCSFGRRGDYLRAFRVYHFKLYYINFG